MASTDRAAQASRPHPPAAVDLFWRVWEEGGITAEIREQAHDRGDRTRG